jgi:hypothetical protein
MTTRKGVRIGHETDDIPRVQRIGPISYILHEWYRKRKRAEDVAQEFKDIGIKAYVDKWRNYYVVYITRRAV